MIKEPTGFLTHVFAEHTERYGDPDVQFHFDPSNARMNGLEWLDVFVWEPTPDVPMTTFSTIGMSERPMGNDAASRAEIHWTIRGRVEDPAPAAELLLALALFPFTTGRALDHWHILPNLSIPEFPGCSAGLFHPALTQGGWDRFEIGGVEIKILNFIPITEAESQMARTLGVQRMLQALYENQTDIFSDRH